MAKVYINGEIVDADKATISVGDAGFLYGAGLFETMRAVDGAVFAIGDHLDRLFFSANSLSINVGCEKAEIEKGIYDVLAANKLTNARMRLTVSNGPLGADEIKPTILITAAKFKAYPAEYYKNGVKVILSSYRQNAADPTCGHKTTSCFSRLIALEHARQKRCAEAIWFTVDNRLAEGSISNVFLVKDSVVYTPMLNTPVLAGVARKTICQIAIEQKIKLIEKNLFIHDLLEADEVFLTNVIMQVLPVVSVEKHTVGDGKVGKMTKRLSEYFEIMVQQSCGKD